MSIGLEMVLQRIERAKEQRRDLEREMRAWAKEGAYRVVSKFDPNTGYTLFRLDQTREITPKIASLIAELLHSLRTALDNVAYQLFIRCRTDPTDEGERIYFPIYDDWVRYSGLAHFDHLIWPTWVVILCIILPVLV